MQKVLITGVNGFVGQYLAEALLECGYKVVGTGKGDCRLTIKHSEFFYHTLDFTDQQAVTEAFDRFQPEIVVHSGALSKPDECETAKEKAFTINVASTTYLLQAASRYKSFFIFLSTDFIFSGNEGSYKEEDSPAPVNYYGHTKWMAENEVRKYPFPWSIVRTILVYGHPKGGRNNILTMVAENLEQGRELRMFTDQERTPTYVEDLVAGLVKIIEKKATGVFHLSGEDKITIYQIAMAVADYLQLDKNLIHPVTEQSFQQPARRPPKTSFDLSRAKTILGYRPTSFDMGLKKTFEYKR